MALARIDTAPSAPWGWAAAGALGGALLSLALFIPASWLASRIDSSTAGQIQLRLDYGETETLHG